MTNENLTNEPKSSQIFLKALREFSESCEPPSLHHDCPFAVSISSDIRGCGEECMDLLGKYGGPAPATEEILGDGLRIRRTRRPRPRHSATRESQPFDARATFLSQTENSPITQWPLQSLLYRLRELSQSPPWSSSQEEQDRADELQKLTDLLTARGLQINKYLETSLRFFVSMSLFAELLVLRRSKPSNPPEELLNWMKFLETETKSLALILDQEKGKDRSSTTLQELTVIRIWSEGSSLEEVLKWQAPIVSLSELLKSTSKKEANESAMDDPVRGRWLFDRFTETYLEKWETNSLCNEWAFIHGQTSPPCSPFELKAREVNVIKLSGFMADRLMKDVIQKRKSHNKELHSEITTSVITSHLVKPAAEFLKEGRFKEAQALFEAILQTDPGSPEANNNLGFCLIPKDPRLSLKYFDEVEKSTGGMTELLAVNRMLALAATEQYSRVIDIASEVFSLEMPNSDESEYPTVEDGGSFVWNIKSVVTGVNPVLEEVADLKKYARAILAIIKT